VVEFALRVGANDLRHRARVEVTTEDVPPVLGNEARLGQVFINLLYNAIQAMQTGNADAHAIAVRVYAPAPGEVAVSVRDNGAGISPENLDRIFEPFFTTKGRGRGEGTGLGLAICRDIIESHGGRIEITSTVGVGTTVRVLLPAHGVTTSPPAPAPAVECEAALPARVLIVDDEPHLRDSLAWLLDPIDCRTAGSIQEAQLELSTEDFGAVLCDLQMPTGLGTELLAWVRVHRPAISARFAVMTGGALSREARTAIDHAGVPVLEKPFTRDAVFTLLRQMQA
jgi:CheY-like chemotaxis protein